MSLEKFFMIKSDEEIVKFVPTDRYKDDDGNPIEWELTPIDSKVDKLIRTSCTETLKNRAKSFNGEKYQRELLLKCVVSPDLMNAELQDFYNVKTPEDLLYKLLKVGEIDQLIQKITKLNGFKSLAELTEEAKNE